MAKSYGKPEKPSSGKTFKEVEETVQVGFDELSIRQLGDEAAIILTRKSDVTGEVNSMKLPVDIEKFQKDLDIYQNQDMFIQDAFKYLDPEQREFVKTGITPDEWDELFPDGTKAAEAQLGMPINKGEEYSEGGVVRVRKKYMAGSLVKAILSRLLSKKGNKLLVKHNHNPKVKSIEDTIDKLQKEIEIEIKNNPDIKEFLDLDNEMQNIYEKHRYAQISEDEAHKRLDILEPNWKELMHKTKNERKKLNIKRDTIQQKAVDMESLLDKLEIEFKEDTALEQYGLDPESFLVKGPRTKQAEGGVVDV